MFAKMRHVRIAGALLLPALLPASAAMGQSDPMPLPPPPPSPVHKAGMSVDLTGLGQLTYAIPNSALVALGAALERYPPTVAVAVDSAGAVTGCAVANGTPAAPAKAGAALCEAIVRTGKFDVPGWYAPSMAGGTVALRIVAGRSPVPRRPVRFVAAPAGKLVTILQMRGECTVAEPFMRLGDKAAVCAAFAKAGRPRLRGSGTVKGAKLRIALAPGAGPYNVWVRQGIQDADTSIVFDFDLPQPEQVLGAADGQISSTVGMMDYPVEALRADMGGEVAVLLGFDRTGKARSCRPVRSTNSSYLANVSCAVLVGKTRFDFAASAPPFDGLRYKEVPIRWIIPDP